MGISLRTHKILWGRSGGKCAICKNDLITSISDLGDDPAIVGDEAHIIARSESFSRGNYDSLRPEERDHYSNLILLCKNHHKQIDDQPEYFTVERLREIKTAHETEIKSQLTGADVQKQRDEILYAGYVDHWERVSELAEWRNISSWVNFAGDQGLPRDWYEAQKQFLIWILGRIWPRRYQTLEKAFQNYASVLRDFINVFEAHVRQERENDSGIYTEKFYKIQWHEQERYDKLSKQYESHVDLVCDLFFELTRAANYICDRVRENIFPDYRLEEGVLLIERNSVGFQLETIRARVEYRGEERTDHPYPGLEEFKEIRYTRDYAIDPEYPTHADFLARLNEEDI